MSVTEAVGQVGSVFRLHRHADGVISFAVKSDDVFCPAFAVRAEDLETVFPEFREQLFKDSYVSINAAFGMARRSKKKLGTPRHRMETIRYLCASYVDIDCHSLGIACEDVLRFARGLVRGQKLPPWTGVVYSGRGVWLLWLLHDASDTEMAHLGAYPDSPRNHLQLYARVGQRLRELLAPVGADPAASDAARYIRMPGSFRTDIEAEVVWLWEDGGPGEAGQGGKAASYALADLAARLGVLEESARRTRTAPEAVGKFPLRRRGRDAANRNRLAAVQLLESVRGGFQDGMRANAAFILAACLKQTGHSWRAAVSELERFGRNCVPPLPRAECLFAVKSAYKKNRLPMRYVWIADTLAVTVNEAALISEIFQKFFPAAAKFCGEIDVSGKGDLGRAPVKTDPRKLRRAKRQAEIRTIVEQLGFIPPARGLQTLLRERGIEISHVSVAEYVREMNLAADFSKHPPAFFCLLGEA